MADDEPLRLALSLARRLRRASSRYRGVYREDVTFGKTGDATYEVDVPFEAEVEDYFNHLGMPCTVMTEDSGTRVFGKNPGYTFLIDPLDGSRNFRRGLPFSCCSIAVYEAGAKELSDAVCGVVERFDMREEYVARRGRRPTLNGKRMAPSRKRSAEDAVIAMGCHFAPAIAAFGDAGTRLGKLTSCDERSIMVKCYGSTALELAYLACGKIDMIYDIRAAAGFRASPKTYDIAAGILLCRTAGAEIRYGGGRLPQRLPVDPNIRVQLMGAGNKALFNAFRNRLRWA